MLFRSDEEAAVFDVSGVLGKPCMLGVVEKESGGKIYSNISSVGPIPRGVPAPQAEGNLLYYAPGEEGMYEHLPKWIKEKLEQQIKPTEKVHSDATHYDGQDNGYITDDDIPF